MTRAWVHERLMKKRQEQPERYLNVQQVIRMLNCSKSMVYKLFESGEIETIRIGAQKGLRAVQSSVESFLDKKIQDAGLGGDDA